MSRSRQPSPRGGQNPAISDLLQRGLALHQSGRAREAAELYQQVLAKDPRQPAANHLLGLVHLSHGRTAEAVDCLSRAVEASPNDSQYLSNLGVALNAAGRSAEAVEVLQRAILANLEFAEAYSNLGMAYRNLKRFDDAVAVYRRAVRLKPNEAGFHFNLANSLRDAGYMFDAESAYRRAVHLRPNYSAAINGLAVMLDGQGRASEALSVVEDALRTQPRDAQLQLRRARALYHQNRIEDSVHSFDKAIALNPSFGEAHLHRSYVVRHEKSDASIDAMKALFRSNEASIDDRVFAGFGLGKALSDIGEHREAIEAFTEANRMNRQQLTFSLKPTIAELKRDLHRFEGVTGPHDNGGFREAMPIFVVGMPRAGKTTVETILSRHPSVAGAGELPTMARLVRELLQQQDAAIADIPPDRFTELGRAYMREAQSLVPPGKAVVDTMPSNYRHIGFIRLALPYARIIRCVRPTPDHCVAIFEKHLTGNGYEYASDMDELQGYHAAFRDLMDGWHAKFPGGIYDIDLGNLAQDRRGEIRRLLEFCGLPWNDACMAEARSEPQYHDWSRDRIAANRAEHMAAWRQVRPQLWD
ncbi:MAG TPA: tetratricopeptide repeat protein [Devosia sp.]|jgi:tetratricopeptide (TPR) repeat protein|uniref:tetratricopeptide repeat-containing sulfotransferase family protein n=1 Tax=Devosia sp. TaxID=1871048 RepID=UPI002DDD0963|nr:tetratricopeptide repeat protein [Devosia sp.]HEV2518746.1 tetratricopeptide repeat protein [Devosia sp.]